MGTSEVSLMLTGQCFITPLPGPLKNKQTNIQGYTFFRAMLAPLCDFHYSHQHSPKFEELIITSLSFSWFHHSNSIIS